MISPFQHSNQLILLFAGNNRSPDYEKALLELSKDPIGLDSRDLLLFEIFQTGGIQPDGSSLSEEEAEKLRDFFKVNKSEFSIVIVDKNLQEIFRAEQPVTVKEIFSAID
ncbi:MAG: DUF4174 domain-containing protein [Cyclobacteriaceae bacterium]|nr:DUF4174 domain-containing protein [Cyclobacteriaceae bacterium]